MCTCFRACFCSLLSSGIAAVINLLAACMLTSVALFDFLSKASELTLLTFLLKRLMRSCKQSHGSDDPAGAYKLSRSQLADQTSLCLVPPLWQRRAPQGMCRAHADTNKKEFGWPVQQSDEAPPFRKRRPAVGLHKVNKGESKTQSRLEEALSAPVLSFPPIGKESSFPRAPPMLPTTP